MAVGIHWVSLTFSHDFRCFLKVFSFIAALGAITIGVSSVPSLANRRVVKAGVVMTTIATVYQLIIRTVAFGETGVLYNSIHSNVHAAEA